MITTDKIIGLVRDGHLTAAEGADLLEQARELRRARWLTRYFQAGLVAIAVAAGLIGWFGCGDNVAPPTPPDAAAGVATVDLPEGGATVPPWHLDAGVDADTP